MADMQQDGPDFRRLATTACVSVAAVAVLALSVAALAGRFYPSATTVLAKPLPLAEVHALAARSAMDKRDWPRARAETLAELQVSPVRDRAWLRLAQLDVAEHGRLGPVGVEALSNAYNASAYDLSSDGARRRFAIAHRNELPDDLKAQIDQEAVALVH